LFAKAQHFFLLAPIAAVSFFFWFSEKRYSGKRENGWQKCANHSLLEIIDMLFGKLEKIPGKYSVVIYPRKAW